MLDRQSVFRKNQQTIEFLRTHDFFRAVESALNALELCRHHLFSNEQEMVSSSYEDNTNTLDQVMFMREVGSNADIAPSTFVYSEGIPIPVQATRADNALVATILVFNAALAHHLLGINNQIQASSDLLRKAKKLYTLAHNNTENGDGSLLFQLSVINNVGMIDQTLGNIESANSCFEYILSTLMFLLDQGYEPSLLSRAQVFLANAPISKIDNAAPAA